MKVLVPVLGTLVLLTGVSGCGEGPVNMLRDENNFLAQVADTLLLVVDEDSAKRIGDRQIFSFQTTWEKMNKRRENFLKVAGPDKDLIRAFNGMQADEAYLKELFGHFERTDREVTRILGFVKDKETREKYEAVRAAFCQYLPMPDLSMLSEEQKALFEAYQKKTQKFQKQGAS